MRDRTGWYEPLVRQLRPWPVESAVTPAILCQVELGLRLLERIAPDEPAHSAWALLGGYPFHAAAGRTPDPEINPAAVRHRLWPMRRGRTWRQNLEAYLRLPERVRGYRVPVEGGPARRLEMVPVAADRFECYDAALRDLPGFATRTLPQAEAGSHRFTQRRRRAAVTIPNELVFAPPTGHDVNADAPRGGSPVRIPLRGLRDTAAWMDEEEKRRDVRPGSWARRLADLSLDVRTPDGVGFTKADEETGELTLDGLVHLVGMVGAGKSTLMTLIAVWAHRSGRRTTLVVGDVAEQLKLTGHFRGLGLSAAPILGDTTRERHAQRLHRRLAAKGAGSLLLHNDPGFANLSTACPLDALRGLDAHEPLRYNDAPCGSLIPVDTPRPTETPGAEHDGLDAVRAYLAAAPSPDHTEPDEHADVRGKLHSCPLWSACPRHEPTRELVDALIWIGTPASLVRCSVPHQLNPERVRYLEIACLRSDIVIVDEVDRVQMQLDEMFAPSATLVVRGPESWLDRLHTEKIDELARQGRIPLSDHDVERFAAALDVVSIATDRLYAMLIGDADLRDWAEIDYFSAWTLQSKLIQDWYPPAKPDNPEALADEYPLYDDADDDDDDGLHGFSGEDDAWTERRAELHAVFDAFRDDPLGDEGPYDTITDELTRAAADLLHTLIGKNTRRRVRDILRELLKDAPDVAAAGAGAGGVATASACASIEARGSEAWLERNAKRLEFTLVLAALHQRLDRLTYLWPVVEAALRLDTDGNDLTRRPPLDYAPLVPESPMGNVLGFQFLPDDADRQADRDGRRSGTLRFFRCAGVGRELLLGLPGLGADPTRGRSGPGVLVMSGTSWAGTSTRAHVLAPVTVVLKPTEQALAAIRRSSFRTEFLHHRGQPLYLSGAHPDKRPQVLALMVEKLASPGFADAPSLIDAEFKRIADPRRRRALILVGSYREAAAAAERLNAIRRWNGAVRVLVSDDTEVDDDPGVPSAGSAPGAGPGVARPGVVRRGDLASFAEDEDAELLVAPLLAIERGHNILSLPEGPNEERVAAFGTVFFLARPHPRPDDLSLAVFAINDWVTRYVRDMPDDDGGTFGSLVAKAPDLHQAGLAFRHVSRTRWRRLLSRRYIESRLPDPEKTSFAWDQLVAIWQVIGRLVRGGVPARVVFVDAAFAPAWAHGAPGDETTAAPDDPVFTDILPPRRRSSDAGLLARLRRVLAPYFDDSGDSGHAVGTTTGAPAASDAALVRLLYQPLYDALCRLDFPSPTPLRGA